ncbi:Holliday junction ATP-dependent DNA helicase RuvA [Leucobacter sp. UT-8R-CII-1-4]|uniref:Holliday junction branch migration protein RuvA n=1 Tax=Leucobacter sp. UT-8R-CII-1-4 TaxID=3040075 RepID=UPI0024A9F41A|nr:Holliday junction branch migration protein RuvA [Leucobacter sp. UT-8R-CII-1-4]MDI6024178.1 Holliday junction ATP-dependent DNA helicase RuvA [Leucobacter sp. UT-8R-CII-1-4]
MISSIRGEVLASGAGWVVIAIGGMGFRVEVPTTLQGGHVGEQLFLHTHLVVREDSLTLFGFATSEELEVFGYLLGVSGVGPRSALGVLSVLTPIEVAQAATSEDEKPFRKVSGIGPKTAKLIALQLAGKLQHLTLGAGSASSGAAQSNGTGSQQKVAATVEQGLLGLGYTEAQSHAAVQDAIEAGAPSNEAGLLRAALMLLQAPRVGGRNENKR